MFRKRYVPSHAAKIVSLLAIALVAHANPVLNQVTSGSATVTQTQNTTTIQQNSDKAIIEWNSFNIGANEQTHFQQPSGGVALNRINPNQGASQIFGTLTATGQIILVNQAGIYFGSGAHVDVGGIIASTTDISNANFLSGNYIFDQPSQYGGSIINQGRIKAENYGLIALVGNNVTNNGYIQAKMGSIVLASGAKFTISFDNDQLINFTIDQPGNGNANVTNTGKLLANGGTITVTAQAAKNVLDDVIDMAGVAIAHSVSGHGGSIYLSGGSSGIVRVSGRLLAYARHRSSGGTVKISGSNIILTPSSVINVNGGSRGNGGVVSVIANNSTEAYGSIYAKGGALGGNGGSVETSGEYLDVNGINVNTSAANGITGNWLLDPADLTICTSCTTNATLASNTYSAGGTGSNLLVTDLTSQLANNSITVQTTSSGSGGNGDIFVNAAISWSSANTLTISAYRNINVASGSTISNSSTGGLTLTSGTSGTGTIVLNAAISLTSGTLTLSTPIAANSITTGVNGAISVYNFILQQGEWTQTGSSLPAFSVTKNFQITSGTTFNGAFAGEFLRSSGSGTGSTNSPYDIVDVYGLQGIATLPLTNNYVIGNDIDATVTQYWNSNAGFIPIGIVSAFTGNFDGQYNVINNLFENNATYGALFANAFASSANQAANNTQLSYIRNVGLTNVNITTTGSHPQGVIVANVGVPGQSYYGGPTISNVFATGTVSYKPSSQYLGGLVGNANGAFISNDYSGLTLTVTGSSDTVGGLVGSAGDGSAANQQDNGPNGDLISNSYNSSIISVTGNSNYLGGVVGYSQVNEVVDFTYSSGKLTATGTSNNVGGLVGNLWGTSGTGIIENSFYDSTIATSASAAVAHSNGTISSYTSNIAGITTANTMNATIVGTYFSSLTSAISSTLGSNTWFMIGGYTRPILISEEFSSGSPVPINTGHQLELINADLSGSYTLGGNVTFVSVISANNTLNASDVWATSTSTGHGFYPIGNLNTNTVFTGQFNGSNSTISNLYANDSAFNYIGLFSDIASGSTVQNVILSNANILSTYTYGGILAAENDGTITNSSSSGTINLTINTVGGLVGVNTGSISNSFSSANVTDSTGYAGGLVGLNEGAATLSRVYATGTVVVGWSINNNQNGGGGGGLIGNDQSSVTLDGSGSNYGPCTGSICSTGTVTYTQKASFNQGGLIGIDYSNVTNITLNAGASVIGAGQIGGLIGYVEPGATISNSSTNYNVTANGYNDIGGFTGYNAGTIQNSYSTGTLSTLSYAITAFGGFVGYNAGTIKNSYTTSTVNSPSNVGFGPGLYIGGFAGQNAAQISNSYSAGALTLSTTGTSINYAGGFVGQNLANGSITNSYSIDIFSVGAATNVGGFSAYNAGTITGSFWNVTTSGIGSNGSTTGSVGGTGMDTADMQLLANYTSATASNGNVNPNWDFTTPVWGIINSHTYPYQNWASQGVIGVVSGGTVSGQTISLAVNGTILSSPEIVTAQSSATTDSNGNFYFLLNKTYFSNSTPLLLYISSGGNSGDTIAYLSSSGPNAATANIQSSTVNIVDTYSSATPVTNTILGTTAGALSSGILYSVASGNLTLNSGVGLASSAGSNYSVEGSITGPAAGNIGGNVNLQGPVTFLLSDTLNAGSNNITFGDVISVLNNSNLTLTSNSVTTGGLISSAGTTNSLTITSNGASNGNLTIGSGGINWAGTGVTLTAASNATSTMYLNGPITLASGTLSLSASNTANSILGNSSINVANFTLSKGEWTQNSAILPAFSVTNNFQITAGSFSNGFNATFLRVVGGNGSSSTPYQLTDIYGVQGVATLAQSNYYNLNNNIEAATTANWFGGLGFSPIGASTSYSGIFNGNNFTITDLNVLRTTGNTGLFAQNSGTLENIGLLAGTTGLVLASSSNTGPLVGVNTGTIYNDYTTLPIHMTITNPGSIGGLVGNSSGLINDSYSAGTISNLVANSGGGSLGGLAGNQSNTIENSHTSEIMQSLQSQGASISGTPTWEGLAGGNVTVLNSYATGAITIIQSSALGGDPHIGGLGGGQQETTVTNSYSAVNITITVGSLSNLELGGLNGEISASSVNITNSYYAGAINITVNGNLTGRLRLGGLVGSLTHTVNITNSYDIGSIAVNVTGTVSTGPVYVGGLTSSMTTQGGATLTGSYSAAPITVNIGTAAASVFVGGLYGLGQIAPVSNSYNSGPISVTIGTISAPVYVGGVVGDDGVLTNTYNTGKITVSGNLSGAGTLNIGGVVGNSLDNVSGSYNTGNVSYTATQNNATTSQPLTIGGVLGTNGSGITLTNSYNTGIISINGPTNAKVGGIVGLNLGTISNNTASTNSNFSTLNLAGNSSLANVSLSSINNGTASFAQGGAVIANFNSFNQVDSSSGNNSTLTLPTLSSNLTFTGAGQGYLSNSSNSLGFSGFTTFNGSVAPTVTFNVPVVYNVSSSVGTVNGTAMQLSNIVNVNANSAVSNSLNLPNSSTLYLTGAYQGYVNSTQYFNFNGFNTFNGNNNSNVVLTVPGQYNLQTGVVTINGAPMQLNNVVGLPNGSSLSVSVLATTKNTVVNTVVSTTIPNATPFAPSPLVILINMLNNNEYISSVINSFVNSADAAHISKASSVNSGNVSASFVFSGGVGSDGGKSSGN